MAVMYRTPGYTEHRMQPTGCRCNYELTSEQIRAFKNSYRRYRCSPAFFCALLYHFVAGVVATLGTSARHQRPACVTTSSCIWGVRPHGRSDGGIAYIYDKKSLPSFFRAMLRIERGGLLLLSTIVPFAIGLCSVLSAASFFGAAMPSLTFSIQNVDFGRHDLITFTLLNIVTFGIGEEAGWRGLALPLLQKRYGALLAAVILSVFWAGWHLPLFLYRPGYVGLDAGGIAGWLVSLLTGSILLSWLFSRSRGSILLCAVFHATVDVAFTYPGTDVMAVSVMGTLITLLGIAAAIHLYRRPLQTDTPKPLSN